MNGVSGPTYEGRFDACEHPWNVKYVVNAWGVVCTVCDPRWAPNPLAGTEPVKRPWSATTCEVCEGEGTLEHPEQTATPCWYCKGSGWYEAAT